MQPSPRIFNPDMDTSPDGSGGADRPTPNSSTHSQHNMSSHTSNSAYSPQNLQQPDINASAQQPSISGMYTQDDLNAFNTDLDMHNFNVPNPSVGALEDFVWNPDMGSVPTGFTPGPTGFTPGPTGGTGFTPGASGMGDFINQFSEADWNDMMQSMSWETDVEHDPARESVMHDRLAKSGLLPREGAWPR